MNLTRTLLHQPVNYDFWILITVALGGYYPTIFETTLLFLENQASFDNPSPHMQ